MLAVLGLLIGALVLWLGVYRPSQAWRNDRAGDLSAAMERHLRVSQMAGRLAARRERAPSAIEDVRGLLTTTARSAELDIAIDDADGGLLVVTDADAPRLFGWLSDLERAQGLQPLEAVIEGDGGDVHAEIRFASGEPVDRSSPD